MRVQASRGMLGVLAVAGLWALAGCGGAQKGAGQVPAQGGAPKKEVRVFIWSEYTDPEVIKEFEQAHGLKVTFSIFESNEQMLAKIQQPGGDALYDIVVPSAQNVPSLIKLGLVQPLDHSRLPNLKGVAQRFREAIYDPGNKYTVPYFWGTTGIFYRKDKLKEAPKSWAALFKDPVGTYAVLDEMRDALGAALIYQGHSANSTKVEELKAAAELLIKVKQHEKFRFFSGGPDGQKKVLAGEVDLAVVWNGEGIRGMREDPQVDFVVPEEGSTLWVDSLTIPKNAPNPEGAHLLINFLCDPKNAARQANTLGYGTPVQEALPLIQEKDRNNPAVYPPEEKMKKLEFLNDLGEQAKLWDELWTQVKSR